MIPLIDTHQHLIYPDRFTYEWTSGIPALASTAFQIGDYDALVAPDVVSSTLFMETSVDMEQYRAETEFALSLAADPRTRMAGVIAAAFPEHDKDFDEWLETCAQDPLVVGFRRILHVVDDAVSKDGVFRANVRKMGAAGKTFDMCFLESQLDAAIELAAACDNTLLVLNHCGVPNVAGGEMASWREKIEQLATMEHVNCKISGVVAYCGPNQDRKTAVQPYIEHIVEKFGPDRCLWGSDWPVVNMAKDLPDWISITRELFASEPTENQAKIFNQTAAKVYNIPL